MGMALYCLVGLNLQAASDPKTAIRKSDRITPKSLVAILASKSGATKPSLIHVGFLELYRQGHIPSSVYAGPGSTPEGLKKLKDSATSLSRSQPLVIYCGCCPWKDCPNVIPAYKLLTDMGFKKIQVLEMQRSFGLDWADKGYPTVK